MCTSSNKFVPMSYTCGLRYQTIVNFKANMNHDKIQCTGVIEELLFFVNRETHRRIQIL